MQGKTVVCVDDNPGVLALYRRLFYRHNPKNFGAVEQALEYIQKTPEEPGVIITDGEMPRHHGLTFLRELNDIYGGSPFPHRYMVSSCHTTEGFHGWPVSQGLEDAVRSLGGQALISKPFNPHELTEKVTSALATYEQNWGHALFVDAHPDARLSYRFALEGIMPVATTDSAATAQRLVEDMPTRYKLIGIGLHTQEGVELVRQLAREFVPDEAPIIITMPYELPRTRFVAHSEEILAAGGHGSIFQAYDLALVRNVAALAKAGQDQRLVEKTLLEAGQAALRGSSRTIH